MSLFEVLPILLVPSYFYPKITSLILGVPFSYFDYLTNFHNFEFISEENSLESLSSKIYPFF